MTGDEYRHEFSAKGPSHLIELGFWQGGPAGYGWSFCALQPPVGVSEPSTAARVLAASAVAIPNSARAR
jgi:hypothetical protein